GKGTNLDRIVAAGDEGKQPSAHRDEGPQVVGDVVLRDLEVAVNRDAVDDADARTALVEEQGVLLPLFRPQHLFDRIVERFHPRLDRGAPLEVPDRVVLEERRGGPEADERGRTDVAAP